MNEALTTIRLNGMLGKKFGRVHQFVVHNTAEAIRTLSLMIPGFQQELMNSQDKGVAYAVFAGKANISKESLHNSHGNKVIKIVPVIQGSKAGGLLNIVLGAVLIVASFFVPGGVAVAAAVFASGASMVLGGVISLLSPQQNISSKNNPSNGTSYNFDGPINTTVQGNPVPLLYGKMIVGSAVISAGIYTQDKQ